MRLLCERCTSLNALSINNEAMAYITPSDKGIFKLMMFRIEKAPISEPSYRPEITNLGLPPSA